MDHWRAAGNKLKTLRYLTESGAAALATSANMQALSYLHEVQSMIEETKKDDQPLATTEETARVESLIGQVRNERSYDCCLNLHFVGRSCANTFIRGSEDAQS